MKELTIEQLKYLMYLLINDTTRYYSETSGFAEMQEDIRQKINLSLVFKYNKH